MGLQIWLPLNGNIYNQGLDGDAITNSSGITYASIGKIGSQSLLSGSMTTSKNYLGYEGTICFWIYITENSNKGMLYGNSDTGASLYNRKWSLFLYPTRNDLHCWGCQKDSKNNSPNGHWQLNGVIPDNKWTHICITHNRSMQYIYINGIQVAHKEWDSSGDITFDVSTPLMKSDVGRYLQDYRIYDNCLSPKQVKEISKGLVCHYPLGEIDGKIGGRNLLRNSKNLASLSIKETLAKVERTDTNCKLSLASGVSSTSWYAIYTDFTIEKNQSYTASIEIETVNLVSGSKGCHFTAAKIPPNSSWNDFAKVDFKTPGKYHYTFNSGDNTSVRIALGVQGDGSSNYVIAKNLKLEKGTSATPWTPAPEDDASFYDNVIYDTSGYGNNGSVSDSTCPTWSSDTPRYKGSYVFNGNKQVIDTPNVFHQEDITISFWFKRLKDAGTRQFLFTIWYGFSCELTTDDIPLFRIATDVSHVVDALSNKKITVNDGWTHFCGVYKNGEYSKIYINGQLKKSVSSASKIHWNIHSSKIGIYSSHNTSYNGQISDVRIYATALSDSDILELYQSSASVDNNGNLMLAGEVIEE